jgi:hypothetical protein
MESSMSLASLSNPRRLAIAIGAAAILAGSAGGAVFAQSTSPTAGTRVESKVKPRSGVVWTATTKPAPKGSHFKLQVTNGATPQNVGVETVVAAKGQGKPAPTRQQLQLAAGETKVIDITNDLSDSARFHARVLSQNSDIQLTITVTDASGTVIQTINKDAFRHVDLSAKPGKGNTKPGKPGNSNP